MKWFVAAALTGLFLTACGDKRPNVIFETDLGNIEIEVYKDKAPISSKDFLDYVKNGFYDGQGFYRAVRPETDPLNLGMEIIQGGRLDFNPVRQYVEHETTDITGLSHTSGAISLARSTPGRGSAANFSISISDNLFLDYGGVRNPDGQGYAAFGYVVDGMNTVRAIQAQETNGKTANPVTEGQFLTHPVIIRKAYIK